MKTYFSINLTGRDWAKPYSVFWIIYLVLNIQIQAYSRPESQIYSNLGLYFFITFLCTVGLIIIQAVFTVIFMRIILPKVSVNGKSFSFSGDIKTFLKINIKGLLLTIITLSVYMPWFARKYWSYLVKETSFDETNPEFLGKSKKLLKYYLLLCLLPAILFSVIFGVLLGLHLVNTGSDYTSETGGAVSLWTTLISVLIMIILIPFIYLFYKWYVDIRFKDLEIQWKTSLWPSCGYILEQVLLTIVTLGIYWPSAALRLYGYFIERTVLIRNGSIIGRLGFEGRIKQGFGLIWGQALLTLVTLGFYFPWAFSRVAGWVAEGTFHENLETSST